MVNFFLFVSHALIKLLFTVQVFDEVEKFKLFDVTEDCSVVDFTKQKSLKIFDVTAGYGFYEFVDPEYIDLGKRIMLLDEVNAFTTKKASFTLLVNAVLLCISMTLYKLPKHFY